MRLVAGCAFICALGASGGAVAQSASLDAERLRDAAFAPSFTAGPADDAFASAAERPRFTTDGRAVEWRTAQTMLRQTPDGSIDTLRMSVGGISPIRADPSDMRARTGFDADAYEIAVTRDWAPVRFDAGRYDVELTSRTGLGVASTGGQAEAGAMVTVAQRRDAALEDRLNDLGGRDGSAYGDTGRWSLFAAASGRAVGLNILRNDQTGWDRDGWSTDASSALIGDAHVGVAWRKGAMQTSLGYIHREVKGEHMVYGQQTKEDSLVALSFSIKPKE